MPQCAVRERESERVEVIKVVKVFFCQRVCRGFHGKSNKQNNTILTHGALWSAAKHLV